MKINLIRPENEHRQMVDKYRERSRARYEADLPAAEISSRIRHHDEYARHHMRVAGQMRHAPLGWLFAQIDYALATEHREKAKMYAVMLGNKLETQGVSR